MSLFLISLNSISLISEDDPLFIKDEGTTKYAILPISTYDNETFRITNGASNISFNVNKDLNSKDSIIKYYQKLLALRKSNNALLYGDYLEYYPNKTLKDFFPICQILPILSMPGKKF